ncbi:MAG: LysM domain-containing protein [Candidatus Gastranaerophilales bacterium]|nr:LysM domain-containing protein [Candidatus Gastranaerophilales bacterium]
MFKNKILASLLALTLAAAPMSGLGMTVSAAENDGVEALAGTAVEEKVTLPEPTGVTWGENYTGHVDASATDFGLYLNWEIYRDGELVSGGGCSAGSEELPTFGTAQRDLNESGEYYYRVRYEQGDEVSPWVKSDTINYVLPDKKIETTIVAEWDDEEAGTINCPTVDNVGGYYITLYKWNETTGEWQDTLCALDVDANLCIDESSFSDSFNYAIDRKGAGKYAMTVQLLSPDVDQWAHGVEGPMSAVYDTMGSASSIKEILSAAMADGDAASAVNTLTATADILEIRMAMQTDAEFRSQVQQLEEQYNRENNITTRTWVSDQAKDVVGSGAVEIVGAGFNGSGSVRLEVDLASPEKQISIYPGYSNSVQLDISLSGVFTPESLRMPVTITMPIPKEISAGQLVILHSHFDGQTENVSFYDNGDGTVTFTVSSFSTFVFAQKGSSEGGSTNTNTANKPSNGNIIDSTGEAYESTDEGDSSVSNGMEVYEKAIAAAVPGAVITIPKSEGITAISNDVMRMLYERNDITLVMEYTYEGVDYRIVIPAGGAVYSDIPWYGPLYLAAHYGNGAAPKNGTAVNGNYVIKSGDTLSKIAQANGLTVSQIAAMNPQIQDVNKIWAGQKIILK